MCSGDLRSPALGGSMMPMILVFLGMFLNTSTMMSSAFPQTNWAFETPKVQDTVIKRKPNLLYEQNFGPLQSKTLNLY